MAVHAFDSNTWDGEAEGLPARDIQDPISGVWKEPSKVSVTSFSVQILFLEKPFQGCRPGVSAESTGLVSWLSW